MLTNCALTVVPDALMAATMSCGVSLPAANSKRLVAPLTAMSVTLLPAVVLVKVTLAPLLAADEKPVNVPEKVPVLGLVGVLLAAALANACATCAAVVAPVEV